MQEKNAEADTLTRGALAQALYAEVGAMGESYRFVTAFFEVLTEQIVANGEVKVHGFGKFRCLEKRRRMGRNPRTGEEVPIEPRRVVSFVASGRFKRLMQDDAKHE